MNPRRQTLLIAQAAEQSPTLAGLIARAQDSANCLKAVEYLLPPALRTQIKAGPLDGSNWCLLAANSAIAAKLRQLLPLLCTHLRAQGREINAIRIKVES